MTAISEDRFCPRCGLATAAALCPREGTATIARTTLDLNTLQLRPGDVLAARYRIVKMLGRGGYGAVFAAEHTGTGQPVALKLLASDPGHSGDENQRRFFREAAITARLRHPNTVRVHDFGQAENGALFMALELIEGPTLAQKLREYVVRGKALPELDAIDMAIAVLRSLGEAHAAELVHRDLKPANIMYAAVPGEDPVVKVLDFGIVRARDSSLTASGTALGTPEYMSPEQCSGEDLDGRSDLYSLGVILFECVTGRLPFIDENPLRVMMAQLSSPAPDVRTFARTALSVGFVDVLTAVLAKSPAERFADAREMRTALEAARVHAASRPKSAAIAARQEEEWAPTMGANSSHFKVRPTSEAQVAGSPGTMRGPSEARQPSEVRQAGPATRSSAGAATKAPPTAQRSQVVTVLRSREFKIGLVGAGVVVVLLAIFAGGYFFAGHKPAMQALPPDPAVEVAENALEPVAKPAGARFERQGHTVSDARTHLTWQAAAAPASFTASQAGHYCKTLALDGAHWRLPKKDELLGLVDHMDEKAFVDAPVAWYWSDSPFQGSATNAWGVDFESKRANPYDVTQTGRVRCVR